MSCFRYRLVLLAPEVIVGCVQSLEKVEEIYSRKHRAGALSQVNEKMWVGHSVPQVGLLVPEQHTRPQ